MAKICEGRETKTLGGTTGQAVYSVGGTMGESFEASIKVNGKVKARIHCRDLSVLSALKAALDECWFTGR